VPHRGQGLHRTVRGKLDASLSQSPVEESLNQQRQRSDKDMCSDSRLDLMIDRPQGQDVLQLAKSPLHIGQVFVNRNRFKHVQRFFRGRDYVLPFDPFLMVERFALAELECPLGIQLVSVISLSMILAQDSFGRLDDLVAVFNAP
jgi:hypothetical protein